jgi:hypothetical protein
MSTTERWVKKHGYGDDPARRAVIDEIVRWLDEGWMLWYVLCWDWIVPPTPEVPMPVAIRLDCAYTTQWVLNGLFPPECDRIRHHLPDDGNGTVKGQEMCVVATLATLLHQRGIRLDERTVSYLHGYSVLFGRRPLSPPPYGRIWLHEYVENDLSEGEHGWDEMADFLAEKQQELQYLGTGRRAPGRPKNEGFDTWASDRFEAVRNVAQVAAEAAERFEITKGAATKRIKRSEWYQTMAPAVVLPKQESASRMALELL